MANWLGTLFQSSENLLAVCAVIAIAALELFGARRAGGSEPEQEPRAISIVAAIAVLVVVALAYVGIGGKKILDPSFAMMGVAFIAILAILLRRFYRSADQEMRKIDAHDL